MPVPYTANTPYINTIPVDKQPPHPGDLAIEHRIRSLNRWNAVATVLRRTRRARSWAGTSPRSSRRPRSTTPASTTSGTPRARRTAATCCSCRGTWRPASTPASFLEGRITEEQLLRFRQEVAGGGLSSYPHPWLMPDYWQFPTVSMGLGPLMSIYQARFLKYLNARGLADTANRHVWAFLGDGEMDEPESLGAISLAGREKLDNLIFVINCNLQRLDGPVRGNGKIIQELEGIFRGAGWNVVKVVWGSGLGPAAGRRQVRAAAQAHGGVRRRRVPGLQVQERRVRPRALLRQVPRAAGPGQGHDRRPDLGAEPRRARPVEGLRGLQGGGGQRRHPDGDPGQDRQGLRDG